MCGFFLSRDQVEVQSQSRIKQWIMEMGLRRYLHLLVLTLVAYYLVSQIVPNWSQLKQYNYHQDPVYGLLSFSCLLVYFAAMAWNWKAILAAYGEKVSLAEAFRIISLAQLGKYIPGGFWALVGQTHLGGKVGLPKAPILKSTLLHLMFTLVSGLEIFLFWRITVAGGEAKWAFVGLLGVVVVFSVTPFYLEGLFDWLVKFLRREETTYLPNSWTVVKTIRFQLLFVCCWLWLGLALWLFVNSLTILPAQLYLDALGAFAVSWVLGVLNVVTPVGIGTREAGFIFFLKDVLPASDVIVIALASRIWITVAELTCAAVAWKLGGQKKPQLVHRVGKE